MKKISIAIGTIALALVFAGCSSTTPTSTPAPAPVVTQDPPVYEPPAVSESDARRQAFLVVIHDEFGYSVSDSQALETGQAICDALSNGASLLQIGQTAVSSGFTAAQAGTLVGASVAGLCPEYEYLVNQLQG